MGNSVARNIHHSLVMVIRQFKSTNHITTILLLVMYPCPRARAGWWPECGEAGTSDWLCSVVTAGPAVRPAAASPAETAASRTAAMCSTSQGGIPSTRQPTTQARTSLQQELELSRVEGRFKHNLAGIKYYCDFAKKVTIVVRMSKSRHTSRNK